MKRKRFIVILAVIIFSTCFFGSALYMRGVLKGHYSSAIQSLKEKDYEACIQHLNKISISVKNLKEYKDSWTIYCQAIAGKRFNAALELEKVGDYAGALKLVRNLEIEGIDKEVVSEWKSKQTQLQDKLATSIIKKYEKCDSDEEKKELIKKYLVKLEESGVK